MARAFLALLFFCWINHVSAETPRPEQRSELQVGGAMRIVAVRKDDPSDASDQESHVRPGTPPNDAEQVAQ